MIDRIRAYEDNHFPRGIAGYRATHALLHPWLIAQHLWLSARWFVQRGRRGYSDADLWNLDGTMDRLLVAGLTSLANAHSYPAGWEYERWQDELRGAAARIQAYIEAEAKSDFDAMEGEVGHGHDEALAWVVTNYRALWD